jgi:hypothetical protein
MMDAAGEWEWRIAERRAARRRRAIRRRRRLAAVAFVALSVPAFAAGAHLGSPGVDVVSAAAVHESDAVAAARRVHPGRLRWLVSLQGQPASIAAENRLPGSRGWLLPPYSQRHGGRVEGYFSAPDALPGERQRLYVNAPRARWVRATIYRIGWYAGAGGRLVAVTGHLTARRQPRCRHEPATGVTDCHWTHPLAFALPRSLLSGVYVVRLTTDRGATRECLFVVESRRPSPGLVLLPTATYEAYNSWGGDSLYPARLPVTETGTSQGVEVSFDRPYDSSSGAGEFFNGDVAMVRFLEQHGYPVSYATGEWLDAHPEAVRGRRLIADVGHSEYWSDRERAAVLRARDAGTNLAFFTSDTMAWRVRFTPGGRGSSAPGAAAHRIVAYKEHASADPRREPAKFPGGAAGVAGVSYEECITPRIPPGTYPLYRYYSWRPGASLQPGWLFRGTGLKAGDEIPGIVGYELDRMTPKSPPGTVVAGSGTTPCENGAPGEADTTVYRARSGALVFATGTLGWELGLSPVPFVSPDAPTKPDPRLTRLTENVFERMLAAKPG